MENNERYEKANLARKKAVDYILNSSAKKKIVVGGPGTGKTHLFQQILEGKINCLTLTFTNKLVGELSLALYGISEVKTLHSFGLAQVKGVRKSIKVHPKLSQVIKEDSEILLGEDINFDKLFNNRDDNNEKLEFYRDRRIYYKHYGYTDIIFTAVKYFEKYANRIPVYTLIIVDEFQDFNKLEVSFIDLLSEKSPVLIVGDDDQALYDFKDASIEHIRNKYRDGAEEFATFKLPYCSRSSRVIVGAINDIIDKAKQNGLLYGRIDKPFLYHESKDKDRVSCENPKLYYTQRYDRQIPIFIKSQMEKIALELRTEYSVLIISPYWKQVGRIVTTMKNYGFRNIDERSKREPEIPTLFDGLKLLLKDKECNLGWRIVSKLLLDPVDFESVLKKSAGGDATALMSVIEPVFIARVKRMLTILRKIKRKEMVGSESLEEFMPDFGFSPYQKEADFLREELALKAPLSAIPGLSKIAIEATSVQSSKGLTSDYVFITHFDDQYFIKDNTEGKISDMDVCSFLVALSRARKRVYLISSNSGQKPRFLKWIDKSRIEFLADG